MAKKHQNEALTKRAYEVRMAADPETHTVEGIPVVFNQETRIKDWWSGDTYREIISSTALDNCDMSDVLLCVNHETEKIPLARSKNGNGTLKLELTPDGLRMSANLDVDRNPEAAALYSAIDRGDIQGMSFMFRVRDDEWEELDSNEPLRTITDISIIHEVSAVTDPAYPQTSITARSSEEAEVSALVEARKKRAEETALMLEKAKNQVKLKWI